MRTNDRYRDSLDVSSAARIGNVPGIRNGARSARSTWLLRVTRAPLGMTLVGLLCALLTVACGKKGDEHKDEKDAPLRIQTEVASTGSMADKVLTAAQVEAFTWQSLYFETGGAVRRVLVEENQTVTKGQLLAELDTESQVNQIDKSKLSLKKAQMDEEQAKHDFENTKVLAESGGASKEQVHDQEQHYLEAQLQREQSELSLKSQEIRLEEMRIRAPFAGHLTAVSIRVGDQVHGDVSDPDKDMNRCPPMVIIDPNSTRTLRAHLPEGRSKGVKIGTPAEITMMERREVVLHGEVVQVGDTVDRDTRTIAVQVSIERPADGYPEALRDGSAALVTFLTEQRENAVSVSEHALYYYQDQAYVFVVDNNGKLERRPITLGLIESGRVEVERGLSAGERVAQSHLYLLRDGQTVLTGDTP